MKHTYHGSCHCKAIVFTAELDFDDGIRKCNCTFCRKTGYQKAFTAFDTLQVTHGRDTMREYLPTPSHWPPGHIHHYYCPACGTHPFSHGFLEQMGGDFWAVNIACLDDADEATLAAAPLIHEDGLRDRQLETPAITSYL